MKARGKLSIKAEILTTTIIQAELALKKSLEHFLEYYIELIRCSRIAVIMRGKLPTSLSIILSSRVIECQKKDGGWSDCEETVWCTSFLEQDNGNFVSNSEKSHAWLKNIQHDDGGWGLSDRDSSRIPTTSLLMKLIPDLRDETSSKWLIKEWKRDLSKTVSLTYKGGFVLMSFYNGMGMVTNEYEDIIEKTIAFIVSQQNEDGGFGPWKGHPIGSDPWSTGICLVGLCSFSELVDKKIIERAVDWLGKTQLPTGYWPCHFIDEGSAYAYWGLKEASKVLEN